MMRWDGFNDEADYFPSKKNEGRYGHARAAGTSGLSGQCGRDYAVDEDAVF